MRHVARPISPFRLASNSMASWVALLIAFILATHAFWCGLGGDECTDISSLRPTSITAQRSLSLLQPTMGQSTIHHIHSDFDVCSGTDETRSLTFSVKLWPAPPLEIWIAVLFVATALTLVPLPRRAAVFGRDGPVRVLPLHSRLVRTSLPHRAPPVFLI